MKKLSSLISGTLGLLLLLLPLALSPWPDPSRDKFALEVEKRPPAAWPHINTWRELLQISTYDRISQALRDRVPLRGMLIVAKNQVAYHLLGERVFGEADVGKNGWLFVRSAYYRPWESEANIRRVLDMLQDILLAYRARKPEMLFVIGPDKDTIYPEMLGKSSQELAAYAGQRRNLIHNFFADHQDLGTLGLWAPYLRAKQAWQEPVFFKYDTHHTPLGTMIMVREMLERLKPGIWKSGEVVRKGEGKKVGDLALLGGLGPISETEERCEVVRPGVRLVREEWLGAGHNWKSPVHYLSASARREMISGKTLVLHDSLLGQSRETLRQFFRDVTFDHYDNHILAARFEADPRAFDRIIIEVAERQFTYVLERLLMQTNAQRVLDVPLDSLRSVNFNTVAHKSPAGLKVKAAGKNPGFLIPSLELPGEENYVVRIDMDASVKTAARLFSLDPALMSHADEPGAFRDIQTGSNVLFFPMNARQLLYAMRFDPGFEQGTYNIRSVQVCALAPRPVPRDDGFSSRAESSGTSVDLWMLQEPGPGAFGRVTCNDQAEILRNAEGLLVNTRGNAPALLLPALAAGPAAKPALLVTLESTEGTQCQVYYRLAAGQDYTEAQCCRQAIRPGRNRFRMAVPAAGVQYGLRFDPGRQSGQYLIRELTLAGLTSSGKGTPSAVRILYPVDRVYHLQGEGLERIRGNATTGLEVSSLGLKIKANDQDPSLALPGWAAGSSDPALLRIRMDSPHATTAQVFYRPSGTEIFNEAMSLRTDVKPGSNELYYLLPAGTCAHTIRFDPACHPGTYLIRSVALGFPRMADRQPAWLQSRDFFENLTPEETQEWYTFRCTETQAAWTPEEVLPAGGAGNVRLAATNGRLAVQALDHDPYFQLPVQKNLAGEHFLLCLYLDAPEDTVCQLYYTENELQNFNEVQSQRKKVQRGPNRLFFYLEAASLRRPLRLDPGGVRGTYLLGPMELRSLRPDAGNNNGFAKPARVFWPLPGA